MQSAEKPPPFVDPSWVREPDVIWRWIEHTGVRGRVRIWRFVDPDQLPAVDPEEWMKLVERESMHPERRKVAHVMATFADHATGGNVRPAMATVGQLLGKERARVNAHVKKLEHGGWLAATGKARKGVIVYALTVPAEVAHNL